MTQAKIETLRKLLEAKIEKCPVCKGTGTIWERHEPPGAEQLECGNCGGIGSCPDPVYAPLLEVARERCPCSLTTDLTASYLPYEEHPLLCKRCWLRGIHTSGCACRGKGFVTRSWEGLPEGALAGALTVALWAIALAELTTGEWAYKVVSAFQAEAGWSDENPDEVLLDMVIEALEKGEGR